MTALRAPGTHLRCAAPVRPWVIVWIGAGSLRPTETQPSRKTGMSHQRVHRCRLFKSLQYDTNDLIFHELFWSNLKRHTEAQYRPLEGGVAARELNPLSNQCCWYYWWYKNFPHWNIQSITIACIRFSNPSCAPRLLILASHSSAFWTQNQRVKTHFCANGFSWGALASHKFA